MDDLVRVPVSVLVDYRSLLATVEALRADVAALRSDLASHVTAERPVIEAHGAYLARLASSETELAAGAVADKRTADASAAADSARIRAALINALAVVVTALVTGLAVYLGVQP